MQRPIYALITHPGQAPAEWLGLFEYVVSMTTLTRLVFGCCQCLREEQLARLRGMELKELHFEPY
jgi:hypothetical protein